MEEIILKLLSNDNVTIQQATLQLREAFKNPENTTILLYQLMTTSKNSEVRQYAAILLRKRFNKGKHWMQLSQNTRNQLKTILIEALMQETEKPVRNAITQLIGVVLKHEIPHNRWPEMLQFIQHLLSSNDINSQTMGMYTLSTITEIAPDAYLTHGQTLMNLLNNILNNCTGSSNQLTSYVLQTMTNLVSLAEGSQEMTNAYHQMIPITVHVIQSLSISSPETAKLGMDLLVELCETAINVISPHVKILVGMCINICNNESIDDEMKTKAVMFIGCLVKIKKKAIIKHKLIEPIVDMLYLQMSLKTDEENEDVYFTGENGNTPITSATQTLDLLALHVPPEKLVTHLLNHIEPSIRGTNVYSKKAAYLALAVLAEGCSEYIKQKYLETFLPCICQGITDDTLLVRNAAFFALGQFSEHLQPDISKFASNLLPVLFQYLADVCIQIKQENKELPSVDRMFYALEILAENLNEALLPYLPTLMNILFEILNCNSPVHVSELALSAIGAAANASKEAMLPYLEKIIMILNRYLTEKQTDETLCLQIQAVDTLGVIARTIGEKNFVPLALKSLQIGLMLLKGTADPDLKKSLYGLFASVSMVVKKDMSSVLPEIFDSLIASIQSSEGINAHFKDDENPNFVVYEGNSEDEVQEEDIENTDNEDDSEDDFVGCSVDNAYVEEKEEAILALSEIAEHSEEVFLPYLERSFDEVFKVINYPQEDIRKAAIVALTRFCINFFRIQSVEGKQSAQKALEVFVPKLSELVRLDEERSVVMEALDSYANLLKEMKLDLLIFNGHEEAIMNCIIDVMLGRTECQDLDEEIDEGEAEHDELLFEYAGEVLIQFGKTVSTESFAFYAQKIFPIFLKKLKNNNNSDSQRSYSIGTMLECFPVLQHKIAPFVCEFLPIFIKLTNDSCDEVRSNAIFGIGELVFYGKELLYSHYLDILQILSNLIAKETHAGARDNVIGAIARLIITNHTIVPLEQVFPVFLNHLPLKEDLEENKTVFKSILVLYQNGNIILHSHIRQLLKVAVETLKPNNVDDETKSLIIQFLQSSQRDFVNDWNSFSMELPTDVAVELQTLLT